MKGQLKKQDFLSLFRKEAEGHIQELNKGLLELENDPQNKAVLEEVRRRAHTLKGSAKMMGFADVSNAAHAMEDLLESVRMELSELDKNLFDKLFHSLDSINALLVASTGKAEAKVSGELEATAVDNGLRSPFDAISGRRVRGKEGAKEQTGEEASVGHSLQAGLGDGREADRGNAGSEGWSAPAGDTFPSMADGAEANADAILVKTDKLDSVAGVVSEIMLDQIKSESQTTKMLSQIASSVSEQFKLWLQIKEKIATEDNAVSSLSESLAGEINSYDELSDRILDDMTKLLEDHTRITTHGRLVVDRLQDDIRSIRLVPVSVIFDTFPRAVRDLGREYNKEIKLEISGGDVELDKSIIDNIKDPLMHLVRNAVDHGIEEPEERLRSGKPETGNISLSAYHQGSKVVIEISDDGAGIDIEKVKQAALKKGYIKEPQFEAMDDESAIRLIFLPGLSTSAIITDVSGRGVGMDVVNETVSRKLKGVVDVHTELGRGTRVSLAVPITLAVMRGLLVKVGNETFAIPTESIKKGDRIPQDQIKSVEGKRVVVEDERIIHLVQLSDILGVQQMPPPAIVGADAEARLGGGHRTFDAIAKEQNSFASEPRGFERGEASSATYPKGRPGESSTTQLASASVRRDSQRANLETLNSRSTSYVNVVIAEAPDHAQKQIGFCVDGFVGEQEMIIKSLGSYSSRLRVPDVAGVTILGNGDVVTILHVSDLVSSAENMIAAALPEGRAGQPVAEAYAEEAAGVSSAPSILVIDDSLTTRELERSILESSGYNVCVAVDGLDGLSKVSERKFDLIVSDVQMPRMDGFQMVEKLKQNEQYKDIPVIMVTALKKDEEKRRGIEVGASAYIIKSSFDQSNLLGTIQRLIG